MTTAPITPANPTKLRPLVGDKVTHVLCGKPHDATVSRLMDNGFYVTIDGYRHITPFFYRYA